MNGISYTEEGAIRAMLVGRTVTKVAEDELLLDDGTRLTIVPNEGCGGCSMGNYELTELNDCPNNAIMAVEFDEVDSDANPGLDSFRLFVFAEDRRIKLLEVEGEDNGYYGVGYHIEVAR